MDKSDYLVELTEQYKRQKIDYVSMILSRQISEVNLKTDNETENNFSLNETLKYFPSTDIQRRIDFKKIVGFEF